MLLAETLYAILFAMAVLAPLRVSLISYLVLSTIDFRAAQGDIGLLNLARGVLLPCYLLWRLRAYAGHRKIILAPIAWILLIIYAAVAGDWSLYPVPALKLVGHMTGSLVVCFVFIRAAKAGYLTAREVAPIAVASLLVGVLCWFFERGIWDERARFTSFTSAQGFAAFLAALYCLALCSKTLRPAVRIPISVVLICAVILNGSRIWFAGIVLATLLALLIADLRPWMKICSVSLVIAVVSVVIGAQEKVIEILGEGAGSNRIAAAITGFYQGDVRSTGLGTFRFRRGLNQKVFDRLENSSAEELIFGHGTCNGIAILGSTAAHADPNRFFHNEWLRVMYEWGFIGLTLWLMLFASIAAFAYRRVRYDPNGRAKPLLVYLPTFLVALAGENFIAASGNSVSAGFLLLIALAAVSESDIRIRFSQQMLLREPVPAEYAHGVAY